MFPPLDTTPKSPDGLTSITQPTDDPAHAHDTTMEKSRVTCGALAFSVLAASCTYCGLELECAIVWRSLTHQTVYFNMFIMIDVRAPALF